MLENLNVYISRLVQLNVVVNTLFYSREKWSNEYRHLISDDINLAK